MTRPDAGFHAFPDRAALIDGLADRFASTIAGSVAARGTCSLVLSGGTTPADLYARLSDMDLPWDRVVLTLSDERWVDIADPASNEQMVLRTLLRGRAAAARLVGLKSPGATPADGLAATEARLAEVPAPYDLMLLGMGEDGHTASLFPGGAGLDHAMKPHPGQRVAGVVPAGGGPARISLTLPALMDSREIALLITGGAKRRVYEQASAAGPVEEMPVRAVLHQCTVPVSVWWAP